MVKRHNTIHASNEEAEWWEVMISGTVMMAKIAWATRQVLVMHMLLISHVVNTEQGFNSLRFDSCTYCCIPFAFPYLLSIAFLTAQITETFLILLRHGGQPIMYSLSLVNSVR